MFLHFIYWTLNIFIDLYWALSSSLQSVSHICRYWTSAKQTNNVLPYKKTNPTSKIRKIDRDWNHHFISYRSRSKTNPTSKTRRVKTAKRSADHTIPYMPRLQKQVNATSLASRTFWFEMKVYLLNTAIETEDRCASITFKENREPFVYIMTPTVALCKVQCSRHYPLSLWSCISFTYTHMITKTCPILQCVHFDNGK